MADYKSFLNLKRKIEKTWNKTEQNLSDEQKLTIQSHKSFQRNFNPAFTIIPLITRQETVYTALRPFIPEAIKEFVISNINTSMLSFSKIVRKFYREQLLDGDIGNEDYMKFEIYTLDNLSWKFVNDTTVLLKIYNPITFFNNQTFMDVELRIKNPNNYTALPKFNI